MSEERIYALVVGFKEIDFSPNITSEFINSDTLSQVNPNDYNIIFIRDLSKISTSSFNNLLGKLQNAKLLFFLPNQSLLFNIFGNQLFSTAFSKGNHVKFLGSSWLAEELRNIKSGITLRYDVEFSVSQNLRNEILLQQSIQESAKLVHQSVDLPEKYTVVATNQAGKTISFILRELWNSVLIVYPYMSDSEDALSYSVKRIIERGIKEEAGIKMGDEPPQWIQDAFPEKRMKLKKLADEFNEINSFIELSQKLYYQSGEQLEKTIGEVLINMGLKVQFIGQSRGQGDLIIEFSNGKRLVTEVKGLRGQADFRHVSGFLAGNPSAKELCFIVNNDLDIPIVEREDLNRYPPFHQEAIRKIKDNLKNGNIEEFYPLSTVVLAKWAAEGVRDLELLKKMGEYRDRILGH